MAPPDGLTPTDPSRATRAPARTSISAASADVTRLHARRDAAAALGQALRRHRAALLAKRRALVAERRALVTELIELRRQLEAGRLPRPAGRPVP